MLQAMFNEQVIARNGDTVVDEGNDQFPLESVRPLVLRRSKNKPLCPWMGPARYLGVKVQGVSGLDASWTYGDLSPLAFGINNRVAFGGDVRVVEHL